MPHNDEVTLHAYLDGALGAPDSEEVRDLEARLSEDPGLRERLDEIGSVRARVDEILGESVPFEIVKPAFAEIQARAARRKLAAAASSPAGMAADGRVPRRRFRMPLAWAATITVAVGAGWMARSVSDEFGAGAPSQVALESVSGRDQVADSPVRLQEAPADAAGPAGSDSPATIATETEARENENTGLVARDAVADPAGERSDADIVVATRRQLADGDDARAEEGKDDNQLAKVAAPGDPAAEMQPDKSENAVLGQGIAEREVEADGPEQEDDRSVDEVARNRAATPPQAAAKSVVGGTAGFHSRPVAAGTSMDLAGCYELDREFFSTGPGRFRLIDEPLGVEDGRYVAVNLAGEYPESLWWMPFSSDSAWVQFSDESGTSTMRLGPSDPGLTGELRSAAGEVQGAKTTVRAVRIACEN